MNDREMIISLLLQSGDRKDGIITELQKKLAETEKQLADLHLKLTGQENTGEQAKPNGVART